MGRALLAITAGIILVEATGDGSLTSDRFMPPGATPGFIRLPLYRGQPPLLHHSQDAGRRPLAPFSFLQVASLASGRLTSDEVATAGHRAASAAPSRQADLYAQIRIGTPPQELSVAVDIGSSNLLLAAHACPPGGCPARAGYDSSRSSTARQLSVADSGTSLLGDDAAGTRDLLAAVGSAEDDLYADTVCLGVQDELCTETAFVRMPQMLQEASGGLPYDGILGVGLPGGRLAGDQRFDLLGNLAEQGLLKRDRFAVWLATDLDDEPSEITFGDFDPKRVGSEMLWIPITSEAASRGMWEVSLADMSVTGSQLGLCGVAGCQAVFDSGTGAIAASESFIGAILNTLSIEEDCSNYASLPLLGFKLGMYILNIEKQDYVKKSRDKCIHQFLKLEIPSPGGPLVLLGEPFLKRYLTIYDRESLKVGVAVASHKRPLGSTETADSVARQLMLFSTPSDGR